uniref:sensor domain-containing diguanylate cyclase n=1 Tax=Cellvibrio fontiphilus TaxID=1815559 RepID=UPI002B4BFBF5|nr:diguanylate cyclase [Cellvibrio fontiphilus]
MRLALWFGGLSLFTLLSVGIYAGWITANQMKINAGEAVHAQAVAAAELLGANLREREIEIVLLSQAPHFVRGDLTSPDILASLDRRRTLRSEFAWLGVADAAGNVIQASNNMLVGQSVAQRPWFIAGLKNVYSGDVHEALLLAKLLPNPHADEPLRFIDFAAPIRSSDGKIVGVVAAHAHWNWVTNTVQAVINRRETDSDAQILIVSNSGNVLYPQALAGMSQLPPNLPLNNTYSIATWDDGRTYITSQVLVNADSPTNFGWRIVVRQSLENALIPVYNMYTQLLVLAFIAVILFALLAWRLAQSVSKPIEQLAAAARCIKHHTGVPQYPGDTSLSEVAQLSNAMQSMTDSLLTRERELELLNQTLEQQVLQRTEALAVANKQLEHLATTDPLTGINNRRRFDETLATYIQMGKRTGNGFSILLLDADHFKKVNDNYGHPVGDAVLQQIAGLIMQNTRATDFVARYGGEEFVVILPNAPSATEVMTVAEKIRSAIESASFPEVGQMTMSIGSSHWHAEETNADDVIQRADEALYNAKASGRNRVVTYEKPE